MLDRCGRIGGTGTLRQEYACILRVELRRHSFDSNLTPDPANACIILNVESRNKCTGHFGLYRNDQGWRIVTKMLHDQGSGF